MRLRAPRWDSALGLGLPRWLPARLLGELAKHMGDRDLERRLGTPVVQGLIFAAMSRSYAPEAAEGFRGSIAFELTRPVSGGRATWWTLDVRDDGVQAHQGRPPDGIAALTARLAVADFLRVAGGVIDPVEPVLGGRAQISGDLGLAARLAEMFGAPRAG